MSSYKKCELDSSKICSGCRECERCDLDSSKLCDSCGKCINQDIADYSEIKLDGILNDMLEVEEYILSDEEFDKIHKMDNQLRAERVGDYLFIEDIPELRDKYGDVFNTLLDDKKKN